MKIVADKEAIQTIHSLCDIALKFGGIQNLNAVNTVLPAITEMPSEGVSEADVKTPAKKTA
ncbi:MAG TPA: hypothetical protein DHV36_16110 [Desulfobacteraceae bacterium]|nr:hypothetical protein [Desulfobacteraceae bacterium]|tara:strand:+ start:2632 stop:2814 length:183 start_codon:yes stop_codon:yes gene_type:complete